MYLRFTLSFRDVEELLAERGIRVSYESFRRWVLTFGPVFARRVRARRPKPHSRWHLDERERSISGACRRCPSPVRTSPTSSRPSTWSSPRATPPAARSPSCREPRRDAAEQGICDEARPRRIHRDGRRPSHRDGRPSSADARLSRASGRDGRPGRDRQRASGRRDGAPPRPGDRGGGPEGRVPRRSRSECQERRSPTAADGARAVRQSARRERC